MSFFSIKQRDSSPQNYHLCYAFPMAVLISVINKKAALKFMRDLRSKRGLPLPEKSFWSGEKVTVFFLAADPWVGAIYHLQSAAFAAFVIISSIRES